MPPSLTYDRHSLAHIVKVKNSQELVDHFVSHLHDGDALRRAGAEHEAKVPCCGHQSALIRRLGLIEELPCQDIQRGEVYAAADKQCFSRSINESSPSVFSSGITV